MAFQLKDFVSITAAMINRAKATQTKITDFNVGSVARTLMESPAIEIEELYQRMFAGIMDAIPVSIYRGFNFQMLDPQTARGTVVISFSTPLDFPITIPAGSVFTAIDTANRYFAVNAVTVEAGATSASVLVEAALPGASYNVGTGAITSLTGVNLPTGSTISNLPITSGSDGETEEERMTRFAAYIESISRGTTLSLRYAAGIATVRNDAGNVVEYVTRVGIDESPGDVGVYLYGSGGAPSADLIAEAQKLIDGYYDETQQAFVSGYRSAGVNVLVLAMQEQAFDLVASITPALGYSLTTSLSNAVVDAVTSVLSDVQAGDTLYVQTLHEAILGVTGVARVRLDLTENYVCPQNVVLVPGNVQVVDGGS